MSSDFKSYITSTPDWPRPGIITYNVSPLFQDAALFHDLIEELAKPYLGQTISTVVGIEARGFILASALAYRLGTGITLIRKKGKLPPPTISEEYSYEYASHVIEIESFALKAQDRVIVVDDILATGGTMAAAVKLIKKCNVEIVGLSFIIYMSLMAGEDRLKGQKINYLISYQ